jgi:hypothetical protein
VVILNQIVSARTEGEAAFEDAVRDAVHSGTEGEAALVAALPTLDEPDKAGVVVAIGDAIGPLGVPMLRDILHSPSEGGDLYYASLIALAKRQGMGASDVFAEWLSYGGESEKRAAMICLACVGDDQAWDVAFERLSALLDRNRNIKFGPPMAALVANSEPAMATCYLARHLAGDEARRLKLGSLLRRKWDQLNPTERKWLPEQWPSIAPEGPDLANLELPHPVVLALWARTPILDPRY